MKITEEFRDRLISTLRGMSTIWYDDPNGPWGFKCESCGARSTDGSSLPPHADDCEVMRLIKELQEMEEEES